MRQPESVSMPGQVWGLAAHSPTGPVFVTSYAGRDLDSTVLAAVDTHGTVLWQRRFDGHPGPPRVGTDRAVWIAHRGPHGPTLTAVDPAGSPVRSIVPEHQPHEHFGAFALMPDGFCIAWLPAGRFHRTLPGTVARLARYSGAGTVWSTPLPLGDLSFPGVVEAGVHAGWRVRPMRPWKPGTVHLHYWQPLLVSADRIVVGLDDYGSGIGVCTIVDATTGRIVATTPPAPYGHKAIAAPGQFLIGCQGYGAFSTTRYDHDGQPVQRWASHGMMLIDRHGTIRGPEMEDILPSRSRFRILNPDGSLADGPPLTGYYTTYPALDTDGTTVFWRDGNLLRVDADLQARALFTSDDDRSVVSRVLLLDQGLVALALADQLLLFHGTGLRPLDTGPWPCGDGNLHGNPAMFT